MTQFDAPAGARPLAGSVGRVVVFVLLFCALALVAQAMLASPIIWLETRTGMHVRLDELTALVAALAATTVMIGAVDVRPWRDVGLGRNALTVRAVIGGGVLGGGAIALACASLLVVGWLRIMPSGAGSSLAVAGEVTAFLVPAALYEELLCRGYLLTALRDSLDARWAVVITSVLFGLLHLQNAGATAESVMIVTLAGIFLAAVRVVFDSLYAAWAAHTAWNWVMAVPLHAPVSGLNFQTPDYHTVSAGPAWITGGSWGPEGGLAAALSMVAALGYLHLRHRNSTTRPSREES